jgi:hypothetical protein
VKLRRANSQLSAASASAEEPVTPPGTPPGTPGPRQNGGKRRGRISRISRKKKNRRGCNYRRTNRRFTER